MYFAQNSGFTLFWQSRLPIIRSVSYFSLFNVCVHFSVRRRTVWGARGGGRDPFLRVSWTFTKYFWNILASGTRGLDTNESCCQPSFRKNPFSVADVVFVVEAWHLELPEGHPRITLGYFTLKALLLYLPHAIVTRLHGRDCDVVILVPDTTDLLGLWEVAGLVRRIRHPESESWMPRPRHRGLTTMRTVFFFTPMMGNLNRSKGVNGTPS